MIFTNQYLFPRVFFFGKPVLDSKSGVPVFKCNCMFFPPNLKASLSV